MALEIERKFLITRVPVDIDQYPHYEILQGYFFNEGEKLVRLRKKGNQYYQTTKSNAGLVREQEELELSPSIFEEERNNVEDRQLQKTRYEIPYKGKIIELDIYMGKLEGLVVAEVEFSSEEEAYNFPLPDRFDRELTEVREAENAYLAKYGIPESLQ